MSKRFVTAAFLVLTAACNRERAHESPRAAAGSPAEEETWVARPVELTPEQIAAVQRALADRGFPVDPTGKLDARTRTALGDFQRSRGLPPTGNLNAETAEALGLDPVAMMPVRAPEELTSEPSPPPPGEEPATRPSRDVERDR